MLSTLLRASIDGGLVVAFVWLLGRLLPRLSARTRTLLWWCAAAKFVLGLVWLPAVPVPILPAGAAATAIGHVEPIATPALTQSNPRAVTGRRAAVDAASPVAPRPRWAVVLVGLWTAGAALAMGLGARRWRQTMAIARQAAPAPAAIQDLAADVAARLGLRRTPAVRVSDRVQTPLVIGFVQPLVILPAARWAALSPWQQRMALCHELTHVERGDLWLGCAPALAERLFFFHPFVHLAAREYALWREAACDARVIDALDAAPQDYGRLLLDLGVSPRRSGLVAAGAPWSFVSLKRRITMLNHPATRSRTSPVVAAAALGLAIAALAPLRLTARPAADTVEPVRHAGPIASPAAEPEQNSHRNSEQRLNYVLVLDDHQTMMSGSMGDIDRARRFKRPGERVLWFRHDGREYVVRDPGILGQVEAVWRPVGEIGAEQGALGAQQGVLGAKQGNLGAQQGTIGAQQGNLGARQGELGARQGVLATRQARTREEQAAIDKESRDLDAEMRALDREMRKLDEKMREFDQPMRELGDQMNVLGREMDVLSKKMDEASRQAEREMRAIVDRVLATGTAERVQ